MTSYTTNSHSAPVELLPVHIAQAFPRRDRLQAGRLQRRDKVLTDRERRVAGEPDVAVAEGQLGEELDDVVAVFGVLVAEEFDVACASEGASERSEANDRSERLHGGGARMAGSSKRTECGQPPSAPPPPPPWPNLPSECPDPLASTEAIAYPHGHHTAGSKPSNFSKPEMSPGTTPHFQGVTGSMEIPLYFWRCDVGVSQAGQGGSGGRGRAMGEGEGAHLAVRRPTNDDRNLFIRPGRSINIGVQARAIANDEFNVVLDEDIRGERLARDAVPSDAGVAGFVDLGLARFEALCRGRAGLVRSRKGREGGTAHGSCCSRLLAWRWA